MTASVPTKMGVFFAEYTQNGLCRLRFPRGKKKTQKTTRLPNNSSHGTEKHKRR